MKTDVTISGLQSTINYEEKNVGEPFLNLDLFDQMPGITMERGGYLNLATYNVATPKRKEKYHIYVVKILTLLHHQYHVLSSASN